MATTSNNIPQGYKATALGIIPQEWEVKRIKDFGSVITGNTPSTLDSENYGGCYMFVSPADLSEDAKYIITTEKTLSDKGFSQARRIPKGSILFTCIGSTIGKIGIASQDLATNQQINSIVTNSEYLFYALSFQSNRIRILANEQAVPIINKSDFEKIKVAFPPLAEQRKIAEVLGVWDEAIERQARLIEKLALRKRGLMQRLLSAKLRLPGFSEKWEEVELGEVLSYEQPTPYIVRDTNYQNDYKIPVLTAGKTFILGYTNEEIGICKNIPVILFDDFTTDSRYIDFEFKVKSSATKLLRAKSQNNLYFIFCALQCFKYSIGGHERHWISKFQYFTIALPSIEEQTAIAEVLTAADREIELAKEKLERLRHQKRGLMQQLLTGKKRMKYNKI